MTTPCIVVGWSVVILIQRLPFYGQNVNSESIHVSGTLEAHKTHAGGFISKQATIPTLVGRSVSKHYGFFLIIL